MKITDLKANEVIHCKTKEEAVRICGMMHDAGLSWCNGVSYMERTDWEVYTEETCYHPHECMFGDTGFYKRMLATIHPSDLFQSDEITEAGLLERGFAKHGSTWNRNAPLGMKFQVSGKSFRLSDDGIFATLPAVKTLSDIDHLIRLLGV